jgi:uncharacterized cupin superfamily protein
MIVTASPEDVDLEDEPIPADWIISGWPEARCKKMVRSHDYISHTVVWDCSQGSFKWQYSMDETIVIISGEALITNDEGHERRIGPGDMAFFPAGSSCTWQVTEHLRKVGVLRESLWRPLGFALKVWYKLLRMTGLVGKSALMLAVAMTLQFNFS